MPIYAYKCSSCGHTKDALQKISDAPLTVCPACGSATFSKQLTAPGFQLKGSGWYVTDFRDGKKPAGDAKVDAPQAGAKSDAEGKGKGDAKTETKTETKSDTAGTGTSGTTAKPAASGSPAPAASAPAAAPAAK